MCYGDESSMHRRHFELSTPLKITNTGTNLFLFIYPTVQAIQARFKGVFCKILYNTIIFRYNSRYLLSVLHENVNKESGSLGTKIFVQFQRRLSFNRIHRQRMSI